jgi:hypothetical protein
MGHHHHHSWFHRITHAVGHYANPLTAIKATEHAGRFLGREAKKETRLAARYTARAYPYIAGTITAVVSYVGTPVAGAVVGTALTEGGYYVGSTAARSHHKHGQEARAAGRRERLRTGEASLIGLGAGTLAGVVAPLAASPASGVSIAGAGADVIPDVAVPSSSGLLGTGITTSEALAVVSAGGGLVSHFITPANPASYPPSYASDLGAQLGQGGGGDQPGQGNPGAINGGFDLSTPEGQNNALLVAAAILVAWWLARA